MVTRATVIKLSVGLVPALALTGLAVHLFWDRDEPPPEAAPTVQLGEIHDIERQADALMGQAFTRRDPKRFDQAARLLAAALARGTNTDRVLAAQAALVLQKNDYFHRRRPPPTEARQLARRALKVNPRCTRAMEVLVHYHELHREHRQALAVAERWLAIAPNDLRASLQVGHELVALERYARAEKVLGHALQRARRERIDEVLIKAQEYLGKAYRLQGKYRLAEQVLLSSVKVMKRSPRKLAACPYASLGNLYTSMGHGKKAATYIMLAADRESRRPNMQYRAAVKCFRVDDFKNALRYVDRALALDDSRLHRGLKARILRARKGGRGRDGHDRADPVLGAFDLAMDAFHEHRFAAAKRHVTQAMKAKKESGHRVLFGFLLLLEKRYKEAAVAFKEAGQKDPGAAVGKGHLALIHKDYKVARPLLEPAVRAGDAALAAGKDLPEKHAYRWMVYRMACLGMGWISANQNQHRVAITYFDRPLSKVPEDIFSWLGKGNSLNALGKLDAAEAALRRVLVFDPDNKYATAELALVKYNKGDNREAERLFKAALKQDQGRYTCPHEGLGLIYLRAGKYAQAKASFRKAIKINPDIEFKKFNGLARIFIREGKYDRARKLLRKSMDNYPHDDEAKKLLATIKGK